MKVFPEGIISLNQLPARRTAILFRFAAGGLVWSYISAEAALTFAGATYQPAAISYQELRSSGAPDDKPIVLQAAPLEPFINTWATICQMNCGWRSIACGVMT